MKVASNPVIFDRRLLRRRLQRAQVQGPVTFLIERMAAELTERLSLVQRSFTLAVDLGTPSAHLRDALRAQHLASRVIGAVPVMPSAPDLPPDLPIVVADGEALPFAEGALDLVVSALALQWVNDLPGTLAQVRKALKPDGLFLAVLAGGDTLTELRQSFAEAEAEIDGGVSPRIAPFADLRDLGGLLQRAGFAMPVTDVDRLTIRYATPLHLLRDLRGMGATNVMIERRRVPLKRTTLLRTAEIYAERFADPDGRVRATVDLVWLSGWTPHESQQQPLKPGSAQSRLADALGTRELGAREFGRRE